MPASPYIVRRERGFRRHQTVVGLGYKDYDAYLRGPHWQSVRVRYRESSEPQDCICGERSGLQLHHLHYDSLGDEALADLTYLCVQCHTMIHALEQRGEIGLDFTGFVCERRAERYDREQQTLARRRSELTGARMEEMHKRAGRSLAAKVRTMYTLATKKKDPLPEADAIHSAITDAMNRLNSL